jgi:hypothetical protein
MTVPPAENGLLARRDACHCTIRPSARPISHFCRKPLLRTTAAVSNILGAPRETVSRMRSTGKPKQCRALAAR